MWKVLQRAASTTDHPAATARCRLLSTATTRLSPCGGGGRHRRLGGASAVFPRRAFSTHQTVVADAGAPQEHTHPTAHTLAVKQLVQTLLRSQNQILAMAVSSSSSRRLEFGTTSETNMEWISYLDRTGYSQVTSSSALLHEAQVSSVIPQEQDFDSAQDQVPPIGYSTSAIPEYDEVSSGEAPNEATLAPQQDSQPPSPSPPTGPPAVDNDGMRKYFKLIVERGDLRTGLLMLHDVSLRNNKRSEPYLPVDLNDILELFYVAWKKKEPLICHHLLNIYIYWDQLEEQGQQQKPEEQPQFDDDNNDDADSPHDKKSSLEEYRVYDDNHSVNKPSLEKYRSQYRQIATVLEHLDPAVHDPLAAERVVRKYIKNIVTRMPPKTQAYILPKVLHGLLIQRFVHIGQEHSYEIFRYMKDNNNPMTNDPKYLEHLMAQARYNRRRDLPYHYILEEVVNSGFIPKTPNNVLAMLEIQYPYNDLEPTHSVLESIVRLIRMERESGTNNPAWKFSMDMAQLELIGAACSKSGASNTMLLVWELMDLLELRPSQGIYEATALTFALDASKELGVELYLSVFSVLSEMEERRGYVPCRALIKALSVHFRKSNYCANRAHEAMMTSLREGKHVSIGAVNVVLATFAERAMVKEIKGLMDFLHHGTSVESGKADLKPDEDSYSFVMECLGKHMALITAGDTFNRKMRIRRIIARRYTRNPDVILKEADDCISKMEEQGLEPNHHFVREYVEFLCTIGDVKTANEMVLKLLEEQEAGGETLVNSKTLYRLAKANDELGDQETGRKIAKYSIPSMNYFDYKDFQEQEAEREREAERARAQQYGYDAREYDDAIDEVPSV